MKTLEIRNIEEDMDIAKFCFTKEIKYRVLAKEFEDARKLLNRYALSIKYNLEKDDECSTYNEQVNDNKFLIKDRLSKIVVSIEYVLDEKYEDAVVVRLN